MSISKNHRLVHLDLKGAPPKPDYLKNLYSLFKKWGATGIIIEWEDCFPFKNDFDVISNKLYSLDNVTQIVQDAKEAKLEVIPLFQTFGHLEFVLKHKNYVQYREVPLFPSSICPSHPNTVQIIMAMLEQIINFHVGLKFLHIGADEVWHMGLCEKCKSRIENGETKEDLFLKHIRKIIEEVKLKWPDINVIMWDDMLRDMDEATLSSYNLKSLLEPMVWHYSPAENFNLPPDLMRKYSYFDNIWVAGAFKGATGGSQLLPVVNHHASNILRWMCLINQLKTNCRGIALTGWSRYDHFAALCELLPTSLPSLGVCLLIVEEKNFDATTISRVEADLGYCNEFTSIVRPSNVPFTFTYLGWEILSGISKFMNIRQSINLALTCEQLETWMNSWQVSKGLVNPMHLVTLVPVLNMYLVELNDLEKFLRNHMTSVFFESTIEEWMGTYISPLKQKLLDVIQTADEQITKNSKIIWRYELCNMSCDTNDEDLKLTKEYKYLLSYIRPLIDQLDKSRDAQLCLLWLSKLEQCPQWERKYRNKILSELCKQVKLNHLNPPFDTAPPDGSLRSLFCSDTKSSECNSREYSEGEISSEASRSSTSNVSLLKSGNQRKRLFQSHCKGGFGDKRSSHPLKGNTILNSGIEMSDHTECFAIQKAYHERAQSDQVVIERYQDIIKSLVSQQLKADISPTKLKKLQSSYENKMTELIQCLKKTQEENTLLRKKVESTNSSLLDELKSENEILKKQLDQLQEDKSSLEIKFKKSEDESFNKLTELMRKLSETEKKLKENERRYKSLEIKYEETQTTENEFKAEINELEKSYKTKLTALERLLQNKEIEVNSLTEEIANQNSQYRQEVSRLKSGISENGCCERDKKKIQFLKNKTKRLEKVRERMAVLFQLQLQQIIAKKDFYIATLEMQLKISKPDPGGSSIEPEIIKNLTEKVNDLEAQYRNLLEEAEQNSLKRRQKDLQKIHTLEKQILMNGGIIGDDELIVSCLKTKSLTSMSAVKDKNNNVHD